jgi:hypothetical protein
VSRSKKKRTDKERLDFIGKRGRRFMAWETGNGFLVKFFSDESVGKDIRSAIDAAMFYEENHP